jgi:DNA-binding beta-propeller fold protein YncE
MKKSVSRREVIAAMSAATFGGAPAVHSKDKSGARLPVTGSGAYTYEVHHDWGQLPKSIRYGNTHGVAVDSKGNVYIHHTVHVSSESEDTMVVFDRKGKFVRSWGFEFKGGAHGLTLRKEGKDEYLYLCDTRRNLFVKTTLKGEEVLRIEYPQQAEPYAVATGAPKKKYSPTNVAIAPDGRFYIADGYGSSYISQYDAKGTYVRTFGGKGKEQGQLDCPHGLTVDLRGSEPVLLVADRTNRRLQTFSLEGKPISLSGQGEVKLPCHFDQFTEKSGKKLLLVPDLEARVSLLDENNKAIVHLGDDPSGTWSQLRKEPRERFKPGQFICPHSACFDKDGNIFVVEWVEVGRVTFLKRVSA